MRSAELLVIGAGPYGLAVSAEARRHGIDTTTVGAPMGFWRDHMPAGMLLRSGAGWHLDAAGEHTFETYLEDSGLTAADVDPIPIAVYLDYTDWFIAQKRLQVDDVRIERLERTGGGFAASLVGGERVTAGAVVAAPGIATFPVLPPWAVDVPPDRRWHTCDLVTFEQLAGARCLIVGGRQSAYEWAALMCDHGAERVDVVHRHDVPRFARADWAFVDAYIADTLGARGWWRALPQVERDAIARRFWAVGRLTLEPWIPSRLGARVHARPRTEVTQVRQTGEDLRVQLSDGDSLTVDVITFATGYRADLGSVPYLRGVLGDVAVTDGFPVLDEAFGTTMAGLYVTGFAATRDFGPFFGFVRGAVPAATLIVDDLLARRGDRRSSV